MAIEMKLPAVLWSCWLGERKSNWPTEVTLEQLGTPGNIQQLWKHLSL